MSKSFKSYLSNVYLSSVTSKQQNLVTVSSTDALGSVMKVLREKKLLAAPVIEKDKLIGFIEMIDIIHHIVVAAKKTNDVHAFLENSTALEKLIEEPVYAAMADKSKKEVLMLYDNNPSTLACELFAKGYHRVALIGDESKTNDSSPAHGIASVVSQSDIIRCLVKDYQNQAIEGAMRTPVAEMGFESGSIGSLNSTDLVLDGLQYLGEKMYAAVPVVDAKSGELVGTFSAKNFRSFDLSNTDAFKMTIKEFLDTYHPDQMSTRNRKPSDSFYYVCETLAKNKLHHLWIVDKNKKPIGVLSLTDLIKLALSYTAKVKTETKEEKLINKMDHAFMTPGTLTFNIVGADNMKKNHGHPYVIVKKSGGKGQEVAYKTKPCEDKKLKWDESFEFEFTSADASSTITAEVWDLHKKHDDKLLGKVDFTGSWILSGFGTKNGANVQCEDVFNLNTKGHLSVQLFYEEKK